MHKLGSIMKRRAGAKRNEDDDLRRNQDADVSPMTAARNGTDDRNTSETAAPSSPPTTSTAPETVENTTKQSSSRRQISRSSSSSKNGLDPLFLYIEAGNLRRATERAKNNPREVSRWATIKIKPSSTSTIVGEQQRLNTTKRLALHQACFKVRTVLYCTVLYAYLKYFENV